MTHKNTPASDEEFRGIPGFPLYDISSQGVIRCHRGQSTKVVKPRIIFGYMKVRLRVANGFKSTGVHRLLLLAFRFREDHAQMHVDHINSKRSDNRLENLRWCTPKENIRFAAAKLVYSGENQGAHILKEADVLWIKKYYEAKNKHRSFKAIGKILGVHRTTVALAYHGKNWGHLK